MLQFDWIPEIFLCHDFFSSCVVFCIPENARKRIPDFSCIASGEMSILYSLEFISKANTFLPWKQEISDNAMDSILPAAAAGPYFT